MSAIVGTTNIDGTGSASNLTAENGDVLDLTFGFTGSYMGDIQTRQQGLVEIYDSWDHYGIGEDRIENIGEWNQQGVKELYIDSSAGFGGNQYGTLTLKNFVDLYLELSSDLSEPGWASSDINIYDIKRGEIDLSSLEGESDVYIEVYSNSANWSNLFTITGSEQSDYLTMQAVAGTRWTEFNIDLSAGDDSFKCILAGAESSSQLRYVDGGDGSDTLIATHINDIDFENFETLINASISTQTLSIDQQLLANNASANNGLWLDGFNIEFSDEFDDIDVSTLSTGKYKIVATYDDEQYLLYSDTVPTELI